jgi:hypothetical protein
MATSNPSSHAARIGGGHLRCCRSEVEAFEQLGDTAAASRSVEVGEDGNEL